MELSAYASTHVGQVRSQNEDAFLIDLDLGLFVVCDGVGGHAAGEVAAALTIEVVRHVIGENRSVLEAVRTGNAAHRELVNSAEDAARAACKAVFDRATGDGACAGMGCTLTMLLVAGARAAMAHVGDSRLYLLRDGACEQLSTDHTMAHELFRQGTLTRAEASDSRYSRVITRCIGTQAMVQVETLALEVLPDDTFLLCSDGLSDQFEGLGEVCSRMADEQIEAIPDDLIRLANERGGPDNITALAVRALYSDREQEEMHQLGQEVRGQLRALRSMELFSEVRFADLLRLRNLCQVIESAAGEVVLRAGDVSGRTHLVLSGRYHGQAACGDPQLLEAGACIGLTALLAPAPSAVTLTCQEAGRLLVLEGERFLALLSRRPWLGVDLLTRLAGEISRGSAQSAPQPPG